MTQTQSNFFLVIEGLDGSGKTQISRRLKSILQQTHGKDVELTFEPYDPSSGGFFIRQVLTKRIKDVPLRTLALAFAFNRADHNDRVIKPFLSTGKRRILICDRYYLSSLVYQSSETISTEEIISLNKDIRQPDITIFLNASTKICYERMGKRPENKELFEKNLSETRQKYHDAIALLRDRGETIFEIDADPDIETVLNSILEVLIQNGPNWLKVQHTLLEVAPDAFSLNGSLKPEKKMLEIVNNFRIDWSMITSEAALSEYEETIEEEINRLSYNDLAHLFAGYLERWGYKFLDRLPWTETVAYELEFNMPLNLKQHGTALLLTETQRYDLVTRKLQILLEQNADVQAIARLSDLMFVLDTTPAKQIEKYYERDTRSTKISPAIRIIGRREIAELVLVDLLAKAADDNVWSLSAFPESKHIVVKFLEEHQLLEHWENAMNNLMKVSKQS